ncbi:MAG: SDR family oxidoreductase [Gammaproteobacteria bacterium]|nr:SDR family oxidoreductase [Gammaproteobacteria bacterium]
MDPAGKRAVVLGGTSGIGLAAARQLHDAGAEVIALSRSASNAASAREVLGQEADIRQLDVLDRDAMAATFAELAPFDILVNAATGGGRARGPFLEMDLDGYQGSFAKLWGYANSVRLGTPHLSQEGCIVLVSGFPARKCPPGYAAISSVGGAVEAFCRAVAIEIMPRRINLVSPGVIDTPMFAAQGKEREQLLEQATQNHLIKRAGTVDEVAQGILFVIRNDFVTGTTVDVDGGALLP